MTKSLEEPQFIMDSVECVKEGN